MRHRSNPSAEVVRTRAGRVRHVHVYWAKAVKQDAGTRAHKNPARIEPFTSWSIYTCKEATNRGIVEYREGKYIP